MCFVILEDILAEGKIAVRGIVDAAVRCEGPAFTTAHGPSRVFYYVECRTTYEGDFRRFVEDATDDVSLL